MDMVAPTRFEEALNRRVSLWMTELRESVRYIYQPFPVEQKKSNKSPQSVYTQTKLELEILILEIAFFRGPRA